MIFWLATGVIRSPYSKRKKDNVIIQDYKTGLEKTVLLGAYLGMAILPLMFVFTPILNFANYKLPISLHLLGIALAPLSLWLFYRSHKDLGLNWSPTLELRAEHTLITKGVYKRIRHPMYSAIWLWVCLQALLLNNFIGGLAGIVGFGFLYFIRVSVEEKMMVQQFGEKYLAYMKTTGRLIPNYHQLLNKP